jgi:hypothetical protein
LLFEFGVQSASSKYGCILGVKFFDFFKVKQAGTIGERVEGRNTDGF